MIIMVLTRSRSGILGYATSSGCTFDDQWAANRLMAGGRDLASAKIAFHRCLGDARFLIRAHRGAVERVARALLDRETLSGAEIDKLMTA
jgi:hypothetical protein